MVKKAKPAAVPPEGSPASSAPSTPRKSAMAERIAQEKARLKRLEHELSEKLKLYGRQQEEGKSPSAPLNKQSQNSEQDTSDVERNERDKTQPPQHSKNTRNSNDFVLERQELDSRGQHSPLSGRQKEDTPSKDSGKSVVVEVSITPEQLERIRKLQVGVL